MGRMRWFRAALVVCGVTACGVDELQTSSTDQALTSSNQVWQNGMTTNALFQNGVFQNQVWQNGVFQNQVWQNQIWQNQVWQNGLSSNQIWQNGLWTNQVWQNGLYQNQVWQNQIWQNQVWQNQIWQNQIWQNQIWQNGVLIPGTWEEPYRHQLLEDNPYTAKVLQYIYSCAMPAGTHKVLDAGGGITVQLDGGVGLAPEWDTPGGACDETCQRWVSACVLARTNAYGVPVDISLRVSNSAPQRIQDALAVSPEEAGEFTLREGSYFGNLFQTTPIDDQGNPLPPGPEGTTSELIKNTPLLYACAAQGSNIPAVTKRFCSSQGNNEVIKVLGNCDPVGTAAPVCSGADASGAQVSCYAPPPPGIVTPDATEAGRLLKFDEVITVYLREPITKCGDGVCEGGEQSTCESDCHPGTWGDSLQMNPGWNPANNTVGGSARSAALADGSMIISGSGFGPFTFGSTTYTSTGGPMLVLAKYSPTGQLVWSTRYNDSISSLGIGGGGVAASTTGAIAATSLYNGAGGSALWIARFEPDALDPENRAPHMAAGWPVKLGASSMPNPSGAPIFDAAGNLYVTGTFSGLAMFGSTQLNSTVGENFIVKLAPSGSVIWAHNIWNGFASVQDMAIDPRTGAQVISTRDSLTRVSATGVVEWTKSGEWHALAIDNLGFIYAAHERETALIEKLNPDGTPVLDAGGHPMKTEAARLCHNGPPTSCPGGLNYVIDLLFDSTGGLVAISHGGGEGILKPRGFDYGAGEFRAYGTPDTYVAAYDQSTLRFRWAKHVPMILDGGPRGASLSPSGDILLAGLFSGSMVADDRFLVSDVPQDRARANVYVAAFRQPSPQDDTPPTMADVPGHIVAQATSIAGARVWYALPTAIDDGNAGVNVVCDHPENTVFPIGDTPVHCTATDPLGNATGLTEYNFIVTVIDAQGPIFKSLPTIPPINATSPSGAVVTYNLPLAFDNLEDRYVTVTCDHLSGSVFAIGVTNVICTAQDAQGNKSTTTLVVSVDPPRDTTPPFIPVPAPISAEATGADGAAVTFTVSAVDETDGNVAVACTPASGSVFAVGQTTVTCLASDQAGNQASAQFVVDILDTTPPILSLPDPIELEATSPAGAQASYFVSAHDIVDQSVVVSCNLASGSMFALGTTRVDCTATDAHDNSTPGSFAVTVVDTTAPSFGPIGDITVEATTLDGRNVSFAPVAFDIVGGTLMGTCSPASDGLFAVGTTQVDCFATDPSGNRGFAHFNVIVTPPPDTTPPHITVPAPISRVATNTTGEIVTYSASAIDDFDGPVAVSCTPASGSTFSLGTTTVTCTAQDATGNRATTTFTVTVAVSWSSFMQPINSDGSSIFKQGNTVPVKFQLTGASAGIANLGATIRVQKILNNVTGSVLETISSGAADTGTTFRYDATSGMYIFNLSTTNLSAGTYAVSALVGTSVLGTVNISIKK
jgi:hypothetical protein